jgi:hypothetical protein
MEAPRSSSIHFLTLTLCHCATLGSSINTLMDLVASSSHLRTASGYYSNLLGIQASYNDSRNILPQIFGQHNVFLWGLGAHFLAFYWCDGPVERLSVPESLDIFSRVGSTQRSTLSGDECPHPQTSTPLWALQPP